MIAPVTWTDEQKATVKEMLERGCSFRSIGDQLGRSKNSVIGVAHRMGLRTGRVRNTRPRIQTVPKIRRQRSPRMKKKHFRKTVTNEAREKALENIKSFGKGISLLEIADRGQCRGVISGEGTSLMYCGQPIDDDKTYCKDHNTLYHATQGPGDGDDEV